jgi:ferritin-like metal-binding protein YciE
VQEVDMLLDAAESEKAAAQLFAALAADCASEELRQKLLTHVQTISDHQRRFAKLREQKMGSRNPM